MCYTGPSPAKHSFDMLLLLLEHVKVDNVYLGFDVSNDFTKTEIPYRKHLNSVGNFPVLSIGYVEIKLVEVNKSTTAVVVN